LNSGAAADAEAAGVRRIRLLHVNNSRRRNARQGRGEFDGGEEAKVGVRDLRQQVRSINPQALTGLVENRAENARRWPVFFGA